MALIPVSHEEASSWSIAQLEQMYTKHIAWAKAEGRFAGDPKLWKDSKALNVMSIRNNDERDPNNGTYNDRSIIFNPSFREVFRVTVDPATEGYRRAHLRGGAWNSYKIRAHKRASMFYEPIQKVRKRWAFCQDINHVEVARTDGNGGLIGYERGKFYINFHDPYKQGADTSLGCTVIKNMDTYCFDFVPLLVDENDNILPVNANNITYLLMSPDQARSYL